MWSPSKRNLYVGLEPHQISMVLASGWGSRNKEMSSARVDVEGGVAGESWQKAVAVLEQSLVGRNESSLHIRVVLSSRFVRWQLLKWRPELTKKEELAAYATASFRETYGKEASTWKVQSAFLPPGQTMPTCAVDSSLLDALRSVSVRTGSRLSAVTPYFSTVFDYWRNRLKGDTIWFGVFESDCISLGLLQKGKWIALRSERFNQEVGEVLPRIIVQMRISNGLDDKVPMLYLAGDRPPPGSVDGLGYTWLQPPNFEDTNMVTHRLALGL